jgi:HEAT repeat protein
VIVHSIHTVLHDPDPERRRLAIKQLEASLSSATLPVVAAALRDADRGVRDAAAKALLAVGGEPVARAVAPYITDTHIAVRNLAGFILTRLGSASALVPYLTHPDKDVRKFAVDILGTLQLPESVDALLPLLEDEDINVVVSTVEALGNIGANNALPQLLQTYKLREEAKLVVVEALSKIADPGTLPFLETAFVESTREPERNPLMVSILFDALSRVGNTGTVQLIRDRLNELPPALRLASLKAMIRIGMRHGTPLHQPEQFESSLMELLHDDDPALVREVIHLLQSNPNAAVSRALLGALGNHEQLDASLFALLANRADTLLRVVELLPERPPAQKVPLIRVLITIASNRACGAAAVLFEPNGEQLLTSVVDVLRRTWEEVDEEGRSEVIDALFLYDGERAVEFLDTTLNDADPWLRAHIVELLGRVTHTLVKQLLVRCAQDEDETVRTLACSTLYRLGDLGGGVSTGEGARTPSPVAPALELHP